MKRSNLRWATKTFILSISMSILFSMISQSLFPSLSIIPSIFIILFFIFLSTVFDMVGVAVTSMDIALLEKHASKQGYKTAIKLCQNTEKVSSFCGDVVGDICGILSGAGGVSLVVNMHIHNANVYYIVTCLVSSLIAGLTIFAKAIMKGYAVENCERVVLLTGKMVETPLLSVFKKRKIKGKAENKNKCKTKKAQKNKEGKDQKAQ